MCRPLISFVDLTAFTLGHRNFGYYVCMLFPVVDELPNTDSALGLFPDDLYMLSRSYVRLHS